MSNDDQILKCRDDKTPVVFTRASGAAEVPASFKLVSGGQCSWARSEESFGPEKLRPRIEPWLTALFQSEHLALLVGSGLAHAVHDLATGDALPGMKPAKFSHFRDEIDGEARRSAEASGRRDGNIEDQLRAANELLRGLDILGAVKPEFRVQADLLREDIEHVLESFAGSVLEAEHGLMSAEPQSLEDAFGYLVSFLMSFASRTGTRDRLQIFTTNYDRFLEAGADAAGLRLLDRFIGTLAPVFRSARLEVDMHYNPPGIRGEPRYLEGVARFTKMHGSLDWMSVAGSVRRVGVPFGAQSIEPYLKAIGLTGSNASQLMIYPNSEKDRETA